MRKYTRYGLLLALSLLAAVAVIAQSTTPFTDSNQAPINLNLMAFLIIITETLKIQQRWIEC